MAIGGSYAPDFYLNNQHEFARWLREIYKASIQRQYGITSAQFYNLIGMLEEASASPKTGLQQLNNYLCKWMRLEDLPAELYPPLTEITPEMFRLEKPAE